MAYIADGRSPTTRGWLTAARLAGVEPVLLSSYPIETEQWVGIHVDVVPIAFSRAVGSGQRHAAGSSSLPARLVRYAKRYDLTQDVATYVRNLGGPVEVRRHTGRLNQILDEARPDVIHALRIPFEGLALGAAHRTDVPLVASIWGNDLTLHARMNPLIGRRTRELLRDLSGLMADTRRDIRLAQELGLSPAAPTLVVPGGGGVDDAVFFPGEPDATTLQALGVRLDRPIILNPRGFRPKSLRQDRFFEALPAVRAACPNTQVVCVAMAGNPIAERAVADLGLAGYVTLLPIVPHPVMAELFRASPVTVSPSVHDGTPNSLLEAMACGVFPIAGNIESAQEWIQHGENGLLPDARHSAQIADSIVTALRDDGLRARARTANAEVVQTRAARPAVAKQARAFYDLLCAR